MFENSTILITGGTGSWGLELVNQIAQKYSPKEIRIFSRGEHKQVEMRTILQINYNVNVKFIIGDVRDFDSLDTACRDVNYVFHLAALKHVPVCEDNPWEAVRTNIMGAKNVIDAAIKNGVIKVVNISTDKAVDPFNLYGITKACSEKLFSNANFNYKTRTRFVCIRGGNVLGTNGSVIPLFKSQVLQSNTMTVTDPKMTRYLMRTREAIRLVFEAVDRALGGEVFVMRMPATSVDYIAQSIRNIFGNSKTEIMIIGARPGEKLDEVLVSRNEAPFTKILNSQYYVILPQLESKEILTNYSGFPGIDTAEFTSANARTLSVIELTDLLKSEEWLIN